MTLPVKKNWGKALENDNPLLVRQLDESYTDIVNAVNTKGKRNASPNQDPPATSQFNISFSVGDIYVREDINRAWILTSRTSPQAVTWTQIT